MTAVENIQLERIEQKLDVLNGFMNTYIEKSIHCNEKFTSINSHINTLYKKADWNRTKILVFGGVVAAAIWFLDSVIKF